MKAVRDESERVRRRLTPWSPKISRLRQHPGRVQAAQSDRRRQSAAHGCHSGGLRRATETPLDCARVCAEVHALSRRASELGYLNVISDGGVGVLAGFTGLRSAALNVYINAPRSRTVPSLKPRPPNWKSWWNFALRRAKRCTR